MTSRERIVATINHRQPDRVPVDFGGTVVTGLAAGVIPRLRIGLGLDKTVQPIKVFEPIQMLGEVADDLRENLHGDCVGIFGTANRFGFKNRRPDCKRNRHNCRNRAVYPFHNRTRRARTHIYRDD